MGKGDKKEGMEGLRKRGGEDRGEGERQGRREETNLKKKKG